MTDNGNETVALHLSGSAKIPQTIILPMKIVARYDVPRRYTISEREQRVPRAIREWMQAQPRYAGMFASTEEDDAIPVITPPKLRRQVKQAPLTDVVQLPPPDAVVTPDNAEAETPAPDQNDDAAQSSDDDAPVFVAEPYPHAAWSRQWNVPDLRAYAKDHDVELTAADRRDAVIAKLEAAGLPDQDTAAADEGEDTNEDATT